MLNACGLLNVVRCSVERHSPSPGLPALGGMPRAEARGGMATGDRGVAHRAPVLRSSLLRRTCPAIALATADGKPGGFGGVPPIFWKDALRGSAVYFTYRRADRSLGVYRILRVITILTEAKSLIFRAGRRQKALRRCFARRDIGGRAYRLDSKTS